MAIDRTALRQTFAEATPRPAAGQRLLLGVDASAIPRPESPTARDRTYQYVHNLPDCAAPVTVGTATAADTAGELIGCLWRGRCTRNERGCAGSGQGFAGNPSRNPLKVEGHRREHMLQTGFGQAGIARAT